MHFDFLQDYMLVKVWVVGNECTLNAMYSFWYLYQCDSAKGTLSPDTFISAVIAEVQWLKLVITAKQGGL